MSETAQSPFVATFVSQIDALDLWLAQCLNQCGIEGARARRARNRLSELKEEVVEICALAARPIEDADVSKLTTYEEFDPAPIFGDELAKRADSGIQDLGANIQDELAQLARARKKELAGTGKDNAADTGKLESWRAMSAADCIEEIGATVMRLAEAARYLFQTEFLRTMVS